MNHSIIYSPFVTQGAPTPRGGGRCPPRSGACCWPRVPFPPLHTQPHPQRRGWGASGTRGPLRPRRPGSRSRRWRWPIPSQKMPSLIPAGLPCQLVREEEVPPRHSVLADALPPAAEQSRKPLLSHRRANYPTTPELHASARRQLPHRSTLSLLRAAPPARLASACHSNPTQTAHL